ADISERQAAQEAIQRLNAELEIRVQQRTADLKDSTDQMETFTYTVAHDLRAPLRSMQGFSNALMEEYSEEFDETGRDFLCRIVKSSVRMDALIQDLLAYSQLSRTDLKFEPIQLQSLVENALGVLADEIKTKKAQISVKGSCAGIVAHRVTLEQILINLISNALKFIAPNVRPRIRIRCEEKPGAVRLWIEDNGIGIEAEHLERVFKIFERLHGGEAYPGTGMGLAIVRKGIERMNGRVGVESKLGRGSRFWIELPRPLSEIEAGDDQ
ncbi:MAG: ATP-binding protein, partial [Verrucomicrobiota bacterium]|nr:ATP-binding protein [Verrucomicrobiota bacterium]